MRSETPINSVLFDMDETLLVHSHSMIELCHRVYQEEADRLSGVEEVLFVNTLVEKANDMWNMMYDGVLAGHVAWDYIFVNTFRTLRIDTCLPELLRERFDALILEATHVPDDVHEVLAALRDAGITTGIVTNGFTMMQTRKIEHHGLDALVDFHIVSESARAHKPDPAIFHHALTKAGVSAQESVFVGDNLTADIAGAVGVGMTAVLIDRKGTGEEKVASLGDDDHRPEHVIASLEELVHLPRLAERLRADLAK